MRLFLAVVAFGFVAIVVALGVAAGEKYSDLKFTVLRDYNGKPIRNASIVLHTVGDDGKQSKGGLQLKTDSEGHTSYAGVPYGKLRIQVIATGFQTFGQDYDIKDPSQEITIKLKRPQEQYTIYGDKPGEQKPDQKPDQNKPDQKKPETPPPPPPQ